LGRSHLRHRHLHRLFQQLLRDLMKPHRHRHRLQYNRLRLDLWLIAKLKEHLNLRRRFQQLSPKRLCQPQ
jgi:hypothetical protein